MKPLCIAHRGKHDKYFENTLNAFKEAARGEYFGIETDIHLTKDNYWVVHHDPDFLSNGQKYVIAEMNKDDVLGKCRHLLHVKKMKFHDQTALNKVSFGRIKYLPRKFNDQKKLHKDTVIRHFAKTIIWVPYFHTRNIKPWNIHMMRKYNIHYIDDILDEYMKIKANFAQNQQN